VQSSSKGRGSSLWRAFFRLTCPACRGYSRAYLHHVIKADEIIGSMLLTWHNLHYYQVLMQGLRDAIAAGQLAAFVAEFHALRAMGDIDPL
jgi:queuine tRNA-ribosyltransferase